MKPRKLVFIISDVNKALAFEWLALHLQSSYDLMFILIAPHDTILERYLRGLQIHCVVVSDQQYPGHIKKWWRIISLLYKEKPAIVHTHLWRATLLGITASWLMRVKKRIFTRHHSTTHYVQYPSGRKWDRMCNRLATHIVAVSKNIEEILTQWDKANPRKIVLVHHGFDFDYFEVKGPRRVDLLRVKYSLPQVVFPVIGVISRYNAWKGVQYIVPAFKELLKKFPAAKLLLANAHGDYEKEIKHELKDLPKNSFLEIPFEQDLAALYQLMDVFIHVPIDSACEAFGQIYVEALISGIPSVFTLSGVAREFVVHKHNAMVVNFKNSEDITWAINEILINKELRENLVENGKRSIDQFSLENHILALKNLYSKG